MQDTSCVSYNPSVSDNLKHFVPAYTRCPSRDPVSFASEGRNSGLLNMAAGTPARSIISLSGKIELAIVVEKCKTG